MMSDTPRSDAQVFVTDFHNRGNEVVQADFARKLERELNEAKALVKGFYWCNTHGREATAIVVGEHHCDPNLGGIMFPCQVSYRSRFAFSS